MEKVFSAITRPEDMNPSEYPGSGTIQFSVAHQTQVESLTTGLASPAAQPDVRWHFELVADERPTELRQESQPFGTHLREAAAIVKDWMNKP